MKIIIIILLLTNTVFAQDIIDGSQDKLAQEDKELVEILSPFFNKNEDENVNFKIKRIKINFISIEKLVAFLKESKGVLLSKQGSVLSDLATGSIILNDKEDNLLKIEKLLQEIDVRAQQVLIETKIVTLNAEFSKAIGNSLSFATTLPYANLKINNTLSGAIIGEKSFGVNLNIGSLVSGFLLDLELSAMESEGLGKIVASPKLITSNLQTAYIEAGEEIPYEEHTEKGNTSIKFKKASLRLKVTPQITSDHKILLALVINQDSRGKNLLKAGPMINTHEINTNVLVDNAQTIVLGGIYKQEEAKSSSRVPFLYKIPLLGLLFERDKEIIIQNEILIFVTTTIL